MNRTFKIFKFTIPFDIGLLLLFATIKFLIHAYVNFQGGYGIFRDEFYYLACANHPDIGYVDQPPFSIYLLAVNRFLFGDSIFALRLLPALFGAATVFFAGLIAREMGGGIRAQIYAAVTTLCMPILLGMNSTYNMNCIDVFLWTLGAYFVVLLIKEEEPRYWLLIGIIIGIGLLNKISMGWFAAGIFIAVIATKERSWLKTRWPYIAGMLAFILFVPFIIWNLQNNFAHLAFIRNATQYKYSSVTAWSFLSGQLLLPNPAALPLWILGLVFFFFHPEGKRYKIIGIIFLTAVVILLVNGHSKSEYLTSAYPMIFAGGGLFFEKLTHSKWLSRSYIIILGISGIIIAPFAIPILPVETFIRYQNVIGINPPRNEPHKLAELPQFYADMFGWEDKAKAVAKAYQSLSAEEQAQCYFFGDDYGRSGAIDYYRKKYQLPPAVGSHNSYWIWGPGNYDGNVLIILGGELDDKKKKFESVEVVDTVYTKYAIPYENNLRVYVCRKMKTPVQEIWPEIKNFN